MFLVANGIDLHVQPAGDRRSPALVLLHSMGTQSAIWAPQVELLSESHYTLRFDLRGHGLSTVTDGPYSIDLLARDVLAAMDALGIEQMHVAGVSIGGMVAQHIAALAPHRIRSLILVDTTMAFPSPSSWRERALLVRTHGTKALLELSLPRWVTPASLQSPCARALRTMLLRTDPEGYAGSAEAIAEADLTASTSALRLPSLILVGDSDVATPVASAKQIQQALRGSRLVVIENAAHIPTVERPEAVSRALNDFLRLFS